MDTDKYKEYNQKLGNVQNLLQLDKRNEDYTKRGIPPIMQVDASAKIAIIGQAPGKKVEENRIPFQDKSGEKLIKWLGMDESTFHSKNISGQPLFSSL